MGPGATHVWGRFPHQPSVTRWLQQHCTTEEESTRRQRAMKQVVQTHDQRTVRRRLARLREPAPALGITAWSTKVEAKLPPLICSVGSARRPSTTKAIDRFFRAFQRFYATRGSVHSVLSGTRDLRLFLVVDVCTQRASTGQAPIAGIMPEARRLPLYRCINAPFRALQERGYVKREAEMADVLRPQETTA